MPDLTGTIIAGRYRVEETLDINFVDCVLVRWWEGAPRERDKNMRSTPYN
jgi:hypothetical protein